METNWMFSLKRFATLNGALVPFFLAAAAPDSCSPTTCPGAAGSAGTGSTPDGSVSCVNDPRVSACATNLEKAGQLGVLKMRILSVNPNPPGRGMNSWVVRVLDSSGNAISGAQVKPHVSGTQPDPYMPDHGHGSITAAKVAANLDGTHAVTDMNFIMPGVWRMGFDIVTPDGRTDTVFFFFCVAG